MRRTRLVWFAMGAAATLLMSLVAAQFSRPSGPKAPVPFIELTEPVIESDEIKEEHSIANATGQIARECGAKFFQTTFLVNDHPARMELPITTDNSDAADCVVRQAHERGIQMRIVFRENHPIG